MKYLVALVLLTWPGSAQAGLCAVRDLALGQRLEAADAAAGDCAGDLVNADEVAGQVLVRSVRRGVGLRRSLLVGGLAVRRGQRVAFTESGAGFVVDGVGRALTDGRVGAVIAVDCGDRKHPRQVLLEGDGRGRIVD